MAFTPDLFVDKSADGRWIVQVNDIVDNEDKKKPFSDDALAEEPGRHGYHLVRRTVTKFHKTVGIPSFRLRQVDNSCNVVRSAWWWKSGIN